LLFPPALEEVFHTVVSGQASSNSLPKPLTEDEEDVSFDRSD
jgi:hypothetical protein